MNIELNILDWIQTLHTPFLDKIMVFITRLGDVGIIWIVLSIVLLLIPKTRKKRCGYGGCFSSRCSTLQYCLEKSCSTDKTI